MARFRRPALTVLGRARLVAVLFGLGAVSLTALAVYSNTNLLTMAGGIMAALGGFIGIAGVLLGREEFVLWGSLLAMTGAGFSGGFGLDTPRHEIALSMIGGVICSMALYELGTTAALATQYFTIENVRERHDMAAVEEALKVQAGQTITLLGTAFFLTLALYAVGAMLTPGGGGSIAVAGTLAASCLTAAAVLVVLRGGKMAPDPTGGISGTARPSNPSGMAGQPAAGPTPPRLPPGARYPGAGPGR